MLTSLSIRDLAVVESLDLDFEPGFTVLTGETGAGKSILLTALGLALGDRADTGLIRAGANRAEVHLTFDLGDAPEACRWLETQDLADESMCLLRRVISPDGRSKAFINNRPVTLQALQELSSRLVEIHGQHAHLALLQASEQRRLLDESAGNQTSLTETAEHFARWRSLDRELADRRRDSAERNSREELLRYQIEELERQNISELDYEGLSNEHTRLANAGRIASMGQQQLDLLYDDEERSVNRTLAQSVHAMKELGQLAPELHEVTEMLQEAQIQIKEAAHTLRRALDGMEADPKRLEWLEERLGDVHRLARKHQTGPRELKAKLQELIDENNSLTYGAERIDKLEQALQETVLQYSVSAERLSERRIATARSLAEGITALIRELGMPYGYFEIDVQHQTESEPTVFGNDRIAFSVAANPGLPPRPIGKVASGGELSRISLAIQVSAIDYKATPTLIFDEVDTGIGGRVAEIVGQKLRILASDRQVFCVTHLPQVAAQGHNHLLVEKCSQDQVTQTSVRPLASGERKQEIARMLGGVRITEQTLAHAEEMLGWAE